MRELACVLGTVLLGCSETPAPATPLPPDVDAVIELRCRQCHGRPRRHFAPMSIVSWEDAHASTPGGEGELVYEAIARRIHDPQFPMPPFMQPELTDDERIVLDAWIAAGAPPATSDGGVP